MFRNIPSRYAQARLVPTLMLRPSGFLYNTRNAESYTCNPVAACLVEALQRGVDPDSLWREVVERFAVSEPLAHRDALQFLSLLHQTGLLALSPAENDSEDEPDDAQAPDEADGPEKPGKKAKPNSEVTGHEP